MTALAYPRLVRRVRAFLIDSLLLPVAAIATAMLGAQLGVIHPYAKLMLLVGPLFVLEPGMVAFTGGTVGHHLMHIRVRSLDGAHNLNFFAATLRFVLKMLFGWASLVFVLTTARHQALHDIIARSIVIHEHPEQLPAYEVLAERTEGEGYVYPAAWRRVLVIVLYLLLATFAYLVTGYYAATADCMEMDLCSTAENIMEFALRVLWLACMVWLAVRGWDGRLIGARRKMRPIHVPEISISDVPHA